MRWIFFHGVFGGWGWEQIDDSDKVIAESQATFDTPEEAERDAAAHGYAPPVPQAAPMTLAHAVTAATEVPALKHSETGETPPPPRLRVVK